MQIMSIGTVRKLWVLLGDIDFTSESLYFLCHCKIYVETKLKRGRVGRCGVNIDLEAIYLAIASTGS